MLVKGRVWRRRGSRQTCYGGIVYCRGNVHELSNDKLSEYEVRIWRSITNTWYNMLNHLSFHVGTLRLRRCVHTCSGWHSTGSSHASDISIVSISSSPSSPLPHSLPLSSPFLSLSAKLSSPLVVQHNMLWAAIMGAVVWGTLQGKSMHHHHCLRWQMVVVVGRDGKEREGHFRAHIETWSTVRPFLQTFMAVGWFVHAQWWFWWWVRPCACRLRKTQRRWWWYEAKKGLVNFIVTESHLALQEC